MELMSFARKIAISSAAALIGTGIVGAAYAITSDSFTYSATKVGYYTISPAGLVYDGSLTTETHFYNWVENSFTNFGSDPEYCYNAPINIPEGAKILSFVVWYSGDKISAVIYSFELFSNKTFTVGSLNGPASANRRYLLNSTVPTTVANATNSYMFGVCLPSRGTFANARIQYTYTNAGV